MRLAAAGEYDMVAALLAAAEAAHAAGDLLTIHQAARSMGAATGVSAASARERIRNALAGANADGFHGLLMLVPDREWRVTVPHRLRLPRVHLYLRNRPRDAALRGTRPEETTYAQALEWVESKRLVDQRHGPGYLAVITTEEHLAQACHRLEAKVESERLQERLAYVAKREQDWQRAKECDADTVALLEQLRETVPGLEVGVSLLTADQLIITLTIVGAEQTHGLAGVLRAAFGRRE